MTRFHSEYKTNAVHLKALSSSENKEMQRLLMNNKNLLWESIQSRIVEIFKATQN